MSRRFVLPAALFFAAIPAAMAADWPQWRCDAGHTAVAGEALAPRLHVQWTRQLPATRPAWRDDARTGFDNWYEPIVLGKTLMVGSNANDTISAYDTDTGKALWTFFADGPVRPCPAAADGKVYVASDDGYLYCLAVANGKLLWKFRGGPDDRKLLGNDRLICAWPARGGPVVADGKVYFAAGIWPFMGVFIHCLDARTGKVLWTNSGSGSDFLWQQHDSPAFAGVAPQGPLTIAGDKLLVSGGRTVPAAYDLKTGKFLYYELADRAFRASVNGYYEVAAIGDFYFNHGNLYRLEDGAYVVGTETLPILYDNTAIGIQKKKLIAYALDPQEKWIKIFNSYRKLVDKQTFALPVSWRLTGAPDISGAYLKAGGRVYVAFAKDGIGAIDIGGDKRTLFEVAWRDSSIARPWTMIAADGKLFVVAQGDKLICLGPNEVAPVEHPLAAEAAAQVQDEWTARAADILKAGGPQEGYCLLLGIGNGRLAEELVSQSRMHVVALDADAAKVDALRRKMNAQGFYGQRLAAMAGDPLAFKLPPYFANLIVSEDAALSAQAPKLYNSLRPYGGAMCLATDTAGHDALTKAVAELRLENAQLRRDGNLSVLVRAGPLAGAGSWTHQSCDAGNTLVSSDKLVRLPLGVLWFGGPSNKGVLPRHGHGPSPQVLGGRLFIEGPDSMRAVDVYTGRLLWEVPLPDIGWFYNATEHQPGANEIGANYATASDGVYVVCRDNCLQLDPATGKTLKTFELPAVTGAKKPYWGYVAVWKDLLIATAVPIDVGVSYDESAQGLVDGDMTTNAPYAAFSKHLVVMDRHTGKVHWTRTADHAFRHYAIAVGGGKVFCIDNWTAQKLDYFRRHGQPVPATDAKLLALDAATGKVAWQTDKGVFGTWLAYREDTDMLLEATAVARDRAPDEFYGSIALYKGADGSVISRNDDPYYGPCMLFRDQIITQGWALDIASGKPKTRLHPLTGQERDWTFFRNYGCNTAIASERMLTFRSAAAGYFDLEHDGGTGNFGGFKSGCTSNLIPADGVLNAPDYTRTCICSYQLQASLALVYMPDVETWTFNPVPPALDEPEPVKRVGVNFGAPGDRKDDGGTYWIDWPSVGGRSPDIPVTIAPADCETFRIHSSLMKEGKAGTLKWVAASGLRGVQSVTIRPMLQVGPQKFKSGHQVWALTQPAQPEGKFDKAQAYTVRLHFAEVENLSPGQRVFDVLLQGKAVLKDFDIVKEAGGANTPLVKEFRSVMITDDMKVEFTARTGQPVICGIEMVKEEQ
ncbi:MAG: PQQ-binding-like beta-propeller repeat protein [Phycisphaerae bacterium]